MEGEAERDEALRAGSLPAYAGRTYLKAHRRIYQRRAVQAAVGSSQTNHQVPLRGHSPPSPWSADIRFAAKRLRLFLIRSLCVLRVRTCYRALSNLRLHYEVFSILIPKSNLACREQ